MKHLSKTDIAAFFSPLSRGFCTFHETESGSRTVFIEYLNIENLDLKKLKTISILFLPGNRISDIAVLSLLTNIQYLNLSENQIIDLAPLQGLENLSHLELQDNQISDITPLLDLPALKYLDLSYNPINDPGTLEELKKRLGGNLTL